MSGDIGAAGAVIALVAGILMVATSSVAFLYAAGVGMGLYLAAWWVWLYEEEIV